MKLENVGPNVLWTKRLTLHRDVVVFLTGAPNKMMPAYPQLYAGRQGRAQVAGKCIQQYQLDAAVVVVPSEQEEA